MTSPIIDENTINSLKEMEHPSDAVPFVDELIHIFLQDGAASAQNLVEAFRGKDYRNMERWAHKLKGQSRNLGAVRLSEVCATIEVKAVKRDPELTESLVQSATKELDVAMQSLRGYLRTA